MFASRTSEKVRKGRDEVFRCKREEDLITRVVPTKDIINTTSACEHNLSKTKAAVSSFKSTHVLNPRRLSYTHSSSLSFVNTTVYPTQTITPERILPTFGMKRKHQAPASPMKGRSKTRRERAREGKGWDQMGK